MQRTSEKHSQLHPLKHLTRAASICRQSVFMFVHIHAALWRENGVERPGECHPIFPILIARDPAAALPPKPLPADDLQGRLCCFCWSTEELITRQCRGFVLKRAPVLGFGERERERTMKKKKKKKKRNLISPSGSCILSFQIVLVTFWPSLVYPDPPPHRLFTVP